MSNYATRVMGFEIGGNYGDEQIQEFWASATVESLKTAREDVKSGYGHIYWTVEETAIFTVADQMKSVYESAMYDLLDSFSQPSLWHDLLTQSVQEIDWVRLATGLVDAAIEEEEIA